MSLQLLKKIKLKKIKVYILNIDIDGDLVLSTGDL